MFCDPPVAEGLGMRSGVQFRGWLRQPTTPEVARSGENGALLLSIGCGEVRFYTILPEVLGLVTLRCTAIAPHHARRPEKVVFVGDVREGHPAVAFPERHREKLYARSILMMQVARMREVVAVTPHSWHIRGTFEAHSWHIRGAVAATIRGQTTWTRILRCGFCEWPRRAPATHRSPRACPPTSRSEWFVG